MKNARGSILLLSLSVLVIGIFAACGGGSGSSASSTENVSALMRTGYLSNPAPYIPSQCYTKTEDSEGGVHNPCYACHIESLAPNYINDAAVQLAYSLPTPALTNHWSNLFKDRSAAFAAIGDADILAYVRASNYLNADGSIKLVATLASVPAAWDADNNGEWNGYAPDLYLRFDDDGFDHDLQGNYTGWRAFAYYPFLGTFWPTNGSTDDVMIRLAPSFRQDESGAFSLTVYRTNLAIVEAMILRRDVTIDATDEVALNVDLDKDGTLGTATRVTYDWAPTDGRDMSYVGLARVQQLAGAVHLAAGLFPEGTEFIHSVRYIDVDDAGNISMAARMKELRYAIKKSWYSYSALNMAAAEEAKEKDQFPERTRQITGSAEVGLSNGQGWTFQSFIEDANGELRPQTYEENVFCMGCHSGIGATTDSNFSFPRKFGASAPNRGWYHWSQQTMVGLDEPVRSDGRNEYAYYLEQNGAGDEFRGNGEVQAKFFNADGSLKSDALAALADDITFLLFPSRERAIALNKGYRVIVQEQSYIYGRDAAVEPAVNVHQSVTEDQPTGIATAVTGP
ncbi:MAG: hypothetical protein KJ634_01245 [Gammaproteobacteria bacterium]|nr:hypothetical protein [Gammaproteobacteria bacterium]MBU1414223.1 hypothetical protein [Gammaproteobacteria bacterium]